MTIIDAERAVTTEVRGRIGVISFARPDRLNALSRATTVQLRDALREMGDRSDIGAVVLRGEGRAFCAGLDLEEGIADPRVPDPIEGMAGAMRTGTEVIWLMRTIPQPIIAAVQGWAVGAGFAFTTAADVRFVGAGAKFSAPFLRLGMTVGDLGLSWFLPRLIGHGRAAKVFFEAGVIDAEQAVEWGLATHVSEDPLAEAMEYAEQVAAFPPYGVATSKDLLNASASSSLRDHLDAEARAQVVGGFTERAKEAMDAALAGTKKKES